MNGNLTRLKVNIPVLVGCEDSILIGILLK
jgi:hypothetical protein